MCRNSLVHTLPSFLFKMLVFWHPQEFACSNFFFFPIFCLTNQFSPLKRRQWETKHFDPLKCITLRALQYYSYNATAHGGKDGAVVRALISHQCGWGSNPGVDAICECEFVVSFLLALRGFSSGYYSFPLSSKTLTLRGFPLGTTVLPSPQKPLLWEVFLRVLQFSPLLKNQHFQSPIRLGIR